MRGLQCESTRVGAIECVYDGDPGLMVLVSRADAQRTHSTRACLPSPLLSRVVPRLWVGRA